MTLETVAQLDSVGLPKYQAIFACLLYDTI